MTTRSLTVMIPALNEEQTVRPTVEGVLAALAAAAIDAEIILVDDGSTDRTRDVLRALAAQHPAIRLIEHARPRGIGFSFREVLAGSTKEAVTWFPADGENNPADLVKYLSLLDHVDIIVPFAVNCGVRSLGRRMLSSLYLAIINITFGTHFNYTNGNVIYRKGVFAGVTLKSDGFFFQTEAMITAIRRQRSLHCEVPIRLAPRRGGKAKALSLFSLLNVMRDYLCLVYEIHVRSRYGAGQ